MPTELHSWAPWVLMPINGQRKAPSPCHKTGHLQIWKLNRLSNNYPSLLNISFPL
jgi:hypothetical protein